MIAVAAASLAGTGAAVAESSHGHSPTFSHGVRGDGAARGQDDLSAAATYLGLTESDLQTKLRSGKTLAEVANATDGKSASGLIDALVQAGRKHITALVNSSAPFARAHGHGTPHGGLSAAATYLGLTESALMTKLQSGETLAQIADSTSGKSKAGLVAALVADEKSHLDQAVKDGRLTQAQADSIAANLEERIAQLVDGTLPHHPDGPPPDDGLPPA
jgi:hypothetical protein